MTALSDKKTEWQPSASIQNLLARAKIIADIRQFFTERGLLEVETPVLSEFGVTDLHLSTFNTEFVAPFDELSKTLWLSTSPEYHMNVYWRLAADRYFKLVKCSVMKKRGIVIIRNLRCLNGIDRTLTCIV